MSTKKPQYYTIPDYLAFESKSNQKHEYEQGLILAMSGKSLINHIKTPPNAPPLPTR